MRPEAFNLVSSNWLISSFPWIQRLLLINVLFHLHSEADQSHNDLIDYLKFGVSLQKRLHLLGESHVFSNVFLQSIDSVHTDNKPQFERAEPSAQRDSPVSVVDGLIWENELPTSLLNSWLPIQLCCRYKGSTTRAWVSLKRSRTHIVLQSKFINSHLFGFVLNDIAYSIPFIRGRNSGQIKAEPE